MNVDNFIRKLTLEEKAVLLQGKTFWTTWDIPRLAIPSIRLSDGPHGVRQTQRGHMGVEISLSATCFPTASAMANSWDPALVEQMGRALGKEAAAGGVHVLLGPGLNLKRSPLCGRNFEYYSEDPFLSGKLAAAWIRGVQAQGVAACPKHFAGNSQELRRMSTDSVIDERTLRELYLTGFEIAVREGAPMAIMASYNPLNGVYACENPRLLQEILRKEWGFTGFVVSDWGACNDPVESIRAGLALNMPAPGLDNAAGVVQAVRDGQLDESALDSRLRELLPVVLQCAQSSTRTVQFFDRRAHHALAQNCASEAIVLLENDGLLPLAPDARVAVIGGLADHPRIQGAGSSRVNPTQTENLLDCLKRRGVSVTAFAPGYRDGATNPALLAEAAAAAAESDLVLLCIGLDDTAEAEGLDRQTLALPPYQQELTRAVCAQNANVVLVLSGGAPFVLPASCRSRAVIHGYLGGQAGAAAMADALTGAVNPSGKLAESWPADLRDTPCGAHFPSVNCTAEYREGLYVGYRYYDTAGIPVRYPFGYGMSYTTFAYSSLTADSRSVSFTLTNTGNRDGAEIVQVYISRRTEGVFRPKKELKGFARVPLAAGESRRVTIPLDGYAFRYFNRQTGRFETETGNYDILVAASVSDVRLRATVRIFGTDAPKPYAPLPSYESAQIRDVPDEEFAQLLGRPIPPALFGGTPGFNDALSRFRSAKSLPVRLFCRHLGRKLEKDPANCDLLYRFHMPLRATAQMSGGRISRKMALDLLELSQGHFFRSTRSLLRHYREKRRREKELKDILEYGPRDDTPGKPGK